MKKLHFGVVLMLLLLVGCRTSKDITSTTPSPQEAVYIQKIAKQKILDSTLTAKAEVELQLNEKQITVNGNLRMKRNDVVQLSLNFFGIEVARLEFTPEGVLIVDRANKRYLRATYADVKFLQQAGLDFYALQALFWNELFIPGETDASSHLSEFIVRKEGAETVIQLNSKPKLNYEFRTETSQSQLTRTTIAPKLGGAGVYCAYDNFKPLEQSQFPTLISLGFSGQQQLGLTLNLSRVNCGDTFTTRTEISNRYKQLSAEDLFGALSKLLP